MRGNLRPVDSVGQLMQFYTALTEFLLQKIFMEAGQLTYGFYSQPV